MTQQDYQVKGIIMLIKTIYQWNNSLKVYVTLNKCILFMVDKDLLEQLSYLQDGTKDLDFNSTVLILVVIIKDGKLRPWEKIIYKHNHI